MNNINKYFGMITLFTLLALGITTNINAANQVTANTMNEVVNYAQSATEDTTINLSATFPENIATTQSIAITNDVAITIDGSNSQNDSTTLRASTGLAHLSINNQANIANRTKPFTIKNINFIGDTTSNIRANRTGGIRIVGKNFIISNSAFNSNYAAILLSSKVDNLNVNNSTFDNNYYLNGAGAINGENNIESLAVSDSTFTGNIGSGFGYNGGAIWVKYGKNITIERSSFIKNISDATGGGGALALTVGGSNGKVDINESYFKENRADTHPSIYAAGSAWADGGAIYMYTLGENQEFNLSNSLFDSNYAQDDGGALLLERTASGNPETPTTVYNNTFINNNAVGKGIAAPVKNGGGAIQVSQQTKTTIDSNTIINNNAGGIGESQPANGGGIATYNAGVIPDCILKNNIILNNTITDSTGAIKDSLYSNVEADNITQTNNIGLDNGSALSSNVTAKNVFSTNTPTLSVNFSTKTAGYNSQNKLMSIPIVPEGLADNTGASSLPSDMRSFSRNTPSDIGAIDMLYLKFHANGGEWSNLPNLAFDGTNYYDANDTDTMYLLGYHNSNLNALTSSNLAKPGYNFIGWSTTPNGDAQVMSNDLVNLTSNTDLYAVWDSGDSLTYTVTFNSLGGSSVSPITNILKNNAIVEPAAPTRAGYTFKGWYQEKSLKNKWNFVDDKVVANITLYAKWLKKTDNVNPKPKEPIKDKLPKTGSDVALLMLISIITSSGLIITNKVRHTKTK